MLTHIKITTAKPSEKLYKFHDTLGLYLAVKPNGSKLWRMNYRFLGKQKTLHLGKWPAVGLAAARAKRDEAREQIAAGMDPAMLISVICGTRPRVAFGSAGDRSSALPSVRQRGLVASHPITALLQYHFDSEMLLASRITRTVSSG